MKRSEINKIIRDAKALFGKYSFLLPKFSEWSPEDYRRNAANYPEIDDCQLGWDVTDFGQGDFLKYGLTLFTIRNGVLNSPIYKKPYAEKIMISRVNQVTLLHYHEHKTEDIINRGGGKLVFEFYHHLKDDPLALDMEREILMPGDGTIHRLKPGERIAIDPGESMTLMPGVFHAFWAEKDDVVIGEVSAVNDDHTDNIFHKPQRRFPEIEEDEAPIHLLVSDYVNWK